MGYGGSARMVLQDENTVIYEYSPYNLNQQDHSNSNHIYDGLITIRKDAMVEPELHEKRKRMPNVRKKLISKRIRRDVDYIALLETNKIIIENSRRCWHFVGTGKDIDMIAMRIVFEIFDQYQDKGILPAIVDIHY